MTGLAPHADFRPGGVETAGRRIMVLLQIGRVAPGALVIPVLVDAGPVQRIAGAKFSVGIEMKPALAALGRWPRVPGDSQSLQAAVGQGDQILLQRRDAEGVGDVEIGQFAVGAIGADPEFSVLLEECALHPVLFKCGAVEAAQNGLIVGGLHGDGVMRAQPVLMLGFVTLRAGARADEFRFLRLSGGGNEKEPRHQEQEREKISGVTRHEGLTCGSNCGRGLLPSARKNVERGAKN